MRKYTLPAVAIAFCALSGPLHAANTGAAACTPTIEKIPSSATSKPYHNPQLLPEGYVEEEFFVACTIDSGAYRTVINVRHPSDTAKETGFVFTETWHWQNDWTLYPKVAAYLGRRNHSTLVIAAHPAVVNTLKKSDPSRYASLVVPEQTTNGHSLAEGQILAQVGALAKANKIPGLTVRHIVLGGMSSSSGQVRNNYIARQHDASRTDGKSIYDGYFPAQTAVSDAKAPIPDLDVPVVEISGESELIRAFDYGGTKGISRRADGPLYRFYEVPGMAHVSTRENPMRVTDLSCEGGAAFTQFPMYHPYAMAFDALVRWIETGAVPAHAPRIDTSADGSVIYRDKYGNAKGGIRNSYLDVPIATYRGTAGPAPKNRNGPRCDKMGSQKPLPAETLRKLYPTHDDYVGKVDADLDRLVQAHWYLKEDADIMRAEARAAPIPAP